MEGKKLKKGKKRRKRKSRFFFPSFSYREIQDNDKLSKIPSDGMCPQFESERSVAMGSAAGVMGLSMIENG